MKTKRPDFLSGIHGVGVRLERSESDSAAHKTSRRLKVQFWFQDQVTTLLQLI